MWTHTFPCRQSYSICTNYICLMTTHIQMSWHLELNYMLTHKIPCWQELYLSPVPHKAIIRINNDLLSTRPKKNLQWNFKQNTNIYSQQIEFACNLHNVGHLYRPGCLNMNKAELCWQKETFYFFWCKFLGSFCVCAQPIWDDVTW